MYVSRAAQTRQTYNKYEETSMHKRGDIFSRPSLPQIAKRYDVAVTKSTQRPQRLLYL